MNRNCIRVLALFGALGLSLTFQASAVQARDRVAALQNPVPPADIPAAKAKKTSSEGRASSSLAATYAPGTIVVKTRERRLYYITPNGSVLRYSVGVGRQGKQWSGRSMISGKYIKPAWSPPDEIIRDNPRIARLIPGGSPSNPMGAAAMTLAGGVYAIHGTNRPGSIGGFVSYGCIRMYNSDILDLFRRVDVGTPVVVE